MLESLHAHDVRCASANSCTTKATSVNFLPPSKLSLEFLSAEVCAEKMMQRWEKKNKGEVRDQFIDTLLLYTKRRVSVTNKKETKNRTAEMMVHSTTCSESDVRR